MKQEELLWVDLCARFPYGVKAQVYGWDGEKGVVEVPLKIYSINTDGYVFFETNDYDVNYLPVEDVRLYLRPMSSMTEEEQLELSVVPIYARMLDNASAQTDWLNAHHFDYRGLIEKGLAIEVTEENNPYKNLDYANKRRLHETQQRTPC